MKIKLSQLNQKLHQLDDRLVNIWLNDTDGLSEDETWDLFLLLLETRVELLKTCQEAGVKLTKEMCLPNWLERLVSKRQAIQLRELRNLSEKLKEREGYSAYLAATKSGPGTNLGESENG